MEVALVADDVAFGPEDFCDLSTFDGTYVAVGARVVNVVTGANED